MRKRDIIDKLPDKIREEIIHTPFPQRSALIKGLLMDLSEKNPYSRKVMRGWAKSFYKAFVKGRIIKKKYNYFIQKRINFESCGIQGELKF